MHDTRYTVPSYMSANGETQLWSSIPYSKEPVDVKQLPQKRAANGVHTLHMRCELV